MYCFMCQVCVPVSECCETNACVLVCLPLSKTGSWWLTVIICRFQTVDTTFKPLKIFTICGVERSFTCGRRSQDREVLVDMGQCKILS